MRSAVVGTKRQPNNNRSRVHDSVNNPRLRSSSLPHGPDLGAQYACPFRNRATPQEIFHFPVRFPLPDSALLGEMNHRHRKAIQDSPGRKSSGNLASIKRERGKTMKILRIPLVIVLLVVAGRGFNANQQAGWCRAVTAISTGRPMPAGRTADTSAAEPCFGSVPAAA